MKSCVGGILCLLHDNYTRHSPSILTHCNWDYGNTWEWFSLVNHFGGTGI